MSGDWDGVDWLEFSPGDFVGTGAFTIAGLINPEHANCALGGFLASATPQGGLLSFGSELYGTDDSSEGYAIATGWQVWAISKAAGSAHYRMHVWEYAEDGSGTMTHGESTGAANHANFSAATQIRVGSHDGVGAAGQIAVFAAWDEALSDADLDTLKSASLSDWAALEPAFGVELDAWAGTSGHVVFAGSSTLTGQDGTIVGGADPTDFDFTVEEAADPGHGSAAGTFTFTGTATGHAPVDSGATVVAVGDTFARNTRFPRSKVAAIVRDVGDPDLPVVLTSPDGTRYQLAVANGGTLGTAAASSPPGRWRYNFPRPRFRTTRTVARAARDETPRVVSPNGTVFRLTVANGGALTAVAEFLEPVYEFDRPRFNTSQVQVLTTRPAPLYDASPDATVYQILVANNGTLSTVEVE